jgi:hypothetical protein
MKCPRQCLRQCLRHLQPDRLLSRIAPLIVKARQNPPVADHRLLSGIALLIVKARQNPP